MKGDPLESLDGPAVDTPAQTTPRVPVSPEAVRWHAVGFLALILGVGIALFFVVSSLSCGANGACSPSCSSERTLFILTVLAGAAGGLIHAASSFAMFAGNRQLYRSWLSWFYLRAPIGALLSLLVYFAYRAGVVGSGTVDSCSAVYTLALAGGIAGLFSKQVADRLSDLVDNLLAPSKKPERKDPLGEGSEAGGQAPGGAAPKQPPSDLVREVQQLLIDGGYLPRTRDSGTSSADGVVGEKTHSAIEAFLRDVGAHGEARAATLGDETAPDFWPNLRDLLRQARANQANP